MLPHPALAPLPATCQTQSTTHSIFGEDVVWIAIQPAFARLRRSDYRMAAAMRVFGGVLIRRAVATERNSTFLARPQMHPVAADLNAFFAFAAVWLFDGLDPFKMSTPSGGHGSLTR